MNADFSAVIRACAVVRKERGEETWITTQLTDAFLELREMGYAHSIECWQGGDLVGGLYGVSLGRCFFGESMFHLVPDSSKVALAYLLRLVQSSGFELVDCQLSNRHLVGLGAVEISRSRFLDRLRSGGVAPSVDPDKGDLSFQDISESW